MTNRDSNTFTTSSLLVSLLTFAAGCTETASVGPSALSAKDLFRSYCAACHGSRGQGGENGAPPLSGAPWISGPDERLARIVLHGLAGRVEVHGRIYELEMPGFGPILSDREIADVLSHARALSDSKLDPVTPETVGRVRKQFAGREQYWSASELESLD